MASSYNSLTLVGNLTRDAESKKVGDTDVARYAIAVNEPGKKGGVLYMDCDHWEPGAVLQYLIRGQSVLAEGILQRQEWDKDGEIKSKMVLKVKRLQLLGSPKRSTDATEPEEEFASF